MAKKKPIFQKGILLDKSAYERSEPVDLSSNYSIIKVNTPVPADRQLYNALPSGLPVIPFFTGFNDFAELMALALEVSPVHAACVQSKARYSLGDGFVLKPGRRGLLSNYMLKLKNAIGVKDANAQRIDDYISSPLNSEGEDLFDIAYKNFYDFYGTGNTYLQLVRGSVGGVKFFKMWHHQNNTVLLEKENPATGLSEAVFISNNWQTGYLVGNAKPDRVGLYPNWTKNEYGGETTVIRVKEYSPRKIHYGLPQSVASLIWQSLEYKIPKFNSDGFDNNFTPSALVQFFGVMSPDEKKKFLNDFQKIFTGDGTTGRVFAQVIASKDMSANVTKFDNDKNQGAYTELDKVTTQKIITAHCWHPVLAGIMTEGRLGGDSKEIRNAWELAENTYIKFARKKIGKMYNVAVYEAMDWLYALKPNWYIDFASGMPISFLGQVNINKVLTKNEAREQAGYEPLKDGDGEDDPKGNELIEDSGTPNISIGTNGN